MSPTRRTFLGWTLAIVAVVIVMAGLIAGIAFFVSSIEDRPTKHPLELRVDPSLRENEAWHTTPPNERPADDQPFVHAEHLSPHLLFVSVTQTIESENVMVGLEVPLVEDSRSAQLEVRWEEDSELPERPERVHGSVTVNQLRLPTVSPMIVAYEFTAERYGGRKLVTNGKVVLRAEDIER